MTVFFAFCFLKVFSPLLCQLKSSAPNSTPTSSFWATTMALIFFSFYLSLSLFHRSIYLHLPFSRYISISSSSQLKVLARQRTVINLLGVREKPAGPPGHSNPGEATWRARQRQRGGSYTRASLLSMAANDVWCVLMKWPQCSWWSRIRDMGKSFWSESELYSQADWLR